MVYVYAYVLVPQLCLTLCDPMDYVSKLPGSSVHGILQARILEWVVIPFQGIFLTQGLLYCRQILYHLSHQGSSPTHQKYQDMRYESLKNSPEFFPLLI